MKKIITGLFLYMIVLGSHAVYANTQTEKLPVNILDKGNTEKILNALQKHPKQITDFTAIEIMKNGERYSFDSSERQIVVWAFGVIPVFKKPTTRWTIYWNGGEWITEKSEAVLKDATELIFYFIILSLLFSCFFLFFARLGQKIDLESKKDAERVIALSFRKSIQLGAFKFSLVFMFLLLFFTVKEATLAERMYLLFVHMLFTFLCSLLYFVWRKSRARKYTTEDEF